MLVHINGSMLLPQVPEVDIFDAAGRQEDDINSVIEYIDQVVMGNKDDTPEDEDNDDGQNLHPVKTCDYYFEISVISLHKKHFSSSSSTQDAEYKENKINSPWLDIIAPPPKA